MSKKCFVDCLLHRSKTPDNSEPLEFKKEIESRGKDTVKTKPDFGLDSDWLRKWQGKASFNQSTLSGAVSRRQLFCHYCGSSERRN